MRTVAVISRKGGSGKSTVALHLALAAFLRGRRVWVAHTDAQRSASQVLKGRKGPGPQLAETTGPKLFALQVSCQRAGYQSAFETGRSVEEFDPPIEAGREVGDLWAFVETFVFGRTKSDVAQNLQNVGVEP